MTSNIILLKNKKLCNVSGGVGGRICTYIIKIYSRLAVFCTQAVVAANINRTSNGKIYLTLKYCRLLTSSVKHGRLFMSYKGKFPSIEL